MSLVTKKNDGPVSFAGRENGLHQPLNGLKKETDILQS